MRFIRYYSHEIYSVLTILLILASALFVTPDMTQKLALIYAFIFLLHEWEENNYPGGFFKMLFGEIAGIEPVPSGDRLKESRRFVYILLVVFTFTPYFLHTQMWLLLPIVYLGFMEGVSHSIVMPRVILKRKYTPGMVTAICQFVLSTGALAYIIQTHSVKAWQYVVAVFIFILGLLFMAVNGMRANGIDPKTMPAQAKRNVQILLKK